MRDGWWLVGVSLCVMPTAQGEHMLVPLNHKAAKWPWNFIPSSNFLTDVLLIHVVWKKAGGYSVQETAEIEPQ